MENTAWVTDQEQARAEQFWQWLAIRGRRSRTLKAYRADWRVFACWYASVNQEPFDLARLAPLDLVDYRAWAQRQHQASHTINRRLGFIKLYASWGAEQQVVAPEVLRALRDIPLVRQQPLAPQALTPADVRRLLKEVELRGSLRDQAILYTLLYTGLRVGELVHLQVDDVVLGERSGTLLIRGDYAKGGKTRRVPVPLEARRRLQALLALLAHHPTGSGPIFLGQRGPLKEDGVGRIVGKYATWARLELVTPHTLRHTFAYTYLEKTHNDLVGLASILGHDRLSTTQIYTQKPLSALQDAVEQVSFF
jgi:site-specific recombinase XerD